MNWLKKWWLHILTVVVLGAIASMCTLVVLNPQEFTIDDRIAWAKEQAHEAADAQAKYYEIENDYMSSELFASNYMWFVAKIDRSMWELSFEWPDPFHGLNKKWVAIVLEGRREKETDGYRVEIRVNGSYFSDPVITRP